MPRFIARGVLLAALCCPALAQAAPSFEYGPEAEARFLERCADTGAAEVACRRLMERLQADLGYAAFLERAEGGPLAFGRLPDTRLAGAAWNARFR